MRKACETLKNRKSIIIINKVIDLKIFQDAFVDWIRAVMNHASTGVLDTKRKMNTFYFFNSIFSKVLGLKKSDFSFL